MCSRLLLLLLLLCAGTAAHAQTAQATLRPMGSSGVTGTVQFTAFEAGTRVVALVRGLGPGYHGLHVHTGPDCSAPSLIHGDDQALHGSPHNRPPYRRAGDLGNLYARDGMARYDHIDPVLRLDGPLAAVGRVVVVHAKRDDLNTQPDGNAGEVIACGVLEATSL
ncbi:MAG: superoxide dismutase family protein [Rhodothermaceae bacterium]|nr:superoxide dismutase family protein [Rhodothermaceae bacterium]